MAVQKSNVQKEIAELENVIDKKVGERMKLASSKWSAMSFKTKLEVIFLGMGIIAFTSVAFTNLKKFRITSSGGSGMTSSGE